MVLFYHVLFSPHPSHPSVKLSSCLFIRSARRVVSVVSEGQQHISLCGVKEFNTCTIFPQSILTKMCKMCDYDFCHNRPCEGRFENAT